MFTALLLLLLQTSPPYDDKYTSDRLIKYFSDIRQVPDHQEVYLSTNGFSSLIFELNQRVTSTSTDQEALLYHFSDLVDENDGRKIEDVKVSGIGIEGLS